MSDACTGPTTPRRARVRVDESETTKGVHRRRISSQALLRWLRLTSLFPVASPRSAGRLGGATLLFVRPLRRRPSSGLPVCERARLCRGRTAAKEKMQPHVRGAL